MCRNIRTLHNFAPPATGEEIRASALQFVRKLSGFTRPSKANEVAFGRAVDQVTQVARELLDSLVTNTPPLSAFHGLGASEARHRPAAAGERTRDTASPKRFRGQLPFHLAALEGYNLFQYFNRLLRQSYRVAAFLRPELVPAKHQR